MKFLCVQCDEPMKLKEIQKQEDVGSLSVVYECHSCLQEIAMLTNPAETQLVSSLGVNIGPDKGQAKCPFTDMVNQATSNQQSSTTTKDDGLIWSEEARIRLHNIPEFIRPMAKMGIENYAKEQGLQEIDIKVLDKARESFGF
jgi:hypothetical protein